MSLIVNLIKKLYAKENYVRLDGSVPVEDRGELIKKFQEGDARFFIGQQHTGGLGITLTAGSYCTFNTNDYSPETRLQAEDRLHRIGQKNSVTYYDIICNNTLDNTILRMLKNKQRLSELVTEKNLKEMVEGVYDNKELQDKNITM
jgi:SNF2 family DNA or RNA helicase